MARPTVGPVLLIVVAALVIGRIAEDGVAADDVEGQGLAGQPRRGGHRDGAGHAIGKPRGPGQHHVSAQRPADHGQQPLDAQVVDQPPLHLDDVADGDDGKIGRVRRPVAGLMLFGPVVPRQPPRQFGQMTK